jgi:hypothetical protein
MERFYDLLQEMIRNEPTNPDRPGTALERVISGWLPEHYPEFRPLSYAERKALLDASFRETDMVEFMASKGARFVPLPP